MLVLDKRLGHPIKITVLDFAKKVNVMKDQIKNQHAKDRQLVGLALPREQN